MSSDPVPSLSAHDLEATAAFWHSLQAAVTTEPPQLHVLWEDAVIHYRAAGRPSPPRITYGVGFIWHADLDAVLATAAAVGLWSVATAEVHDRQAGFEDRLAAGRTIARIGRPRRTPTDVWECRLFDPTNNLLRLVAGPPQTPDDRSTAPGRPDTDDSSD